MEFVIYIYKKRKTGKEESKRFDIIFYEVKLREEIQWNSCSLKFNGSVGQRYLTPEKQKENVLC